MRVVLGFVAAMTASTAYACDTEMLALESWSARLVDERSFSLSVEIENTGDRAFRMIEGTVEFADTLGRPLGVFLLPEDLAMAPGAKASPEWPRVRNVSGEPRLATIDPNDVKAEVCVTGVVYDDGTVEPFD